MFIVSLKEEWINKNYNFLDLLPVKKINSILGKDAMLKVYKDAEIKEKEKLTYNTVIVVRAHNEGMKELLYRYFDDICIADFESLFNIYLPQILISDSMGFERPVISLHITKLNKYEIFINNIILYRDNTTRLLNGVFDDVLNRLKEFGRLEGIKYISGHASLHTQLTKFLSKGFQIDKRKDMRNDELWAMSELTRTSFPFYMAI